MKREPTQKPCANKDCDKQFMQYKSTVKVCSMACAIQDAKTKRVTKDAKEWNTEKKTRELTLMSKDKYRVTYIQPLVNHLARIIDNEQPCICTDTTEGKMNGGHRHSVGSNVTLALNLHNIHQQSYQSNHHQSGDHLKYRAGLKRVYSSGYADYIDETLMQCPALHLTKGDLIELKPRLQKIVNHYKKLNKVYNPVQRIKLRNKLNEELGIYPKEYAVFTN